jgi:DNA (cytosine-5)-methyltransferase 1
MAMRLLDLFSGIGGFSYAAEKLIGGYETVAFCEMDEFCQKVLKKHWPQVPIFDDVRTLDAARLGRIDICTFGFPCQPVSQAGLQRAESDSRWLWDEIIRILQVSKPKWIIAENVVGLITIENGLLIENCISSLEAEGYEVQSVVIPACAKNAPHRRSRIWLIGQNVDDTNDSTDRAKRGKTREKNSLQKEYRQEGFAWFSDRTSDDSESMADTTSKGKWKITKGLGESQKEMGEKRSEFTTRSDTSSTETGTDVADSDSIRCRGGNCKGCSECKRQVLSTERKGREVGSEVKGCSQSHRGEETVANTSSEGSQRGIHRGQIQKRQTEQQYIGHTSTVCEQPKQRAETVVGKLGDMADGISRGLLRHFDREPEHIPRVTTGEKDRAKKLKALGNSIVPQVAAEILLAIRVSEGKENGSN